MTRTPFLVGALLVLGAALPGGALPATAGSGSTFRVSLRGTEVVPSGAPGAVGFVVVKLHPGKQRICWRFSSFEHVGNPTGAEIEHAHRGTRGPVVQPLGKSYKASGCTKSAKKVMAAILKQPALYYVVVTTGDRPGGAIRGQFAK